MYNNHRPGSNELALAFTTYAQRNDPRIAELGRKGDEFDLTDTELDELMSRCEVQHRAWRKERERLGLPADDMLL